MPLNPDTMKGAVLKLTDQDDPGFVGFPPDAETTAANWAAAAREFFEEIALPQLLPGVQDLGEEAFRAAAVGSISLPGAGAAALDLGFLEYAGKIALGFNPAGASAATPPPAPLALGAALLPFVVKSQTVGLVTPDEAAAAIGARVYAWAITGMFTPVPPGPLAPWS